MAKHRWESNLPEVYATETVIEGPRRGKLVRCSSCGTLAVRVGSRVRPSAAFTISIMTEWGRRAGSVRLKSCPGKAVAP